MIIFKKQDAEKIIAHCKSEFPNEACGILSGKNKTVTKVYEMTNSDKSPQSYLMEPKEQFKVIKEIRNQGRKMLAIYHSHVASGAYPSAHDVELALYPEASYVIVSLKDKGKPDIRSFKIIEGKITEEPINIQ